MKVLVLYEFSAQPNSGELSIKPNETLTVTRQDVGDGWWEGVNSRGEKGLFPAEYVSAANDAPQPPQPPPPPSSSLSWDAHPAPQQQQTTATNSPPNAAGLLSFVTSSNAAAAAPAVQQQAAFDQQNDGDWGDDDWDDDDSQASEFTVGGELSSSMTPHGQLAPIHVGGSQGVNNGNKGTGGQGQGQGGPQPVKKSINRFSHFVKSGGEDYILGLKTVQVNQNDLIHIIDEGGVFKWSPSYFTYEVVVENPKKESKMKGLKSYIAYQLTPSDSREPVSRRYKHFDWLHERLQEKFTTIPIPSLPDKQISGRYQEDFIQGRRIQLQSWVNRICRHPVLSQSTVWKHFITCKDEKQWKTGKRRAEKDELVSGFFFLSVQVPEGATISPDTENRLETFARFITKMDDSTKNIYAVSQEFAKRYQSFYKREFGKVAGIFNGLSEAFLSSPVRSQANQSLVAAIKRTSAQYEAVGKLFDEQHWHDFGPLANLMHEYRGVLDAWPEISAVYRGAIAKKKEHQKAFAEGRLEEKAMAGINHRADVVTYATLAEMNHFEEERIIDYRRVMRTFLTGQLNLYKTIVANLEDALAAFPPEQ